MLERDHASRTSGATPAGTPSAWSPRTGSAGCPGYALRGDDPDGFMIRDEIVAYLARLRRLVRPAAARAHAGDALLEPRTGGGFVLETTPAAGTLDGRPGRGRHRRLPRRSCPRWAERAARSGSRSCTRRTTATREQLPDGAVLVVGTGQSGAQIAEDLHLAGRTVHLARRVGAPRVARFYRGRDCVAWLDDMGHYDMPVEQHRGGERGAGEHQPLRHRPRRRARHRPARVRPRGHAALRPAHRAAPR